MGMIEKMHSNVMCESAGAAAGLDRLGAVDAKVPMLHEVICPFVEPEFRTCSEQVSPDTLQVEPLDTDTLDMFPVATVVAIVTVSVETRVVEESGGVVRVEFATP